MATQTAKKPADQTSTGPRLTSEWNTAWDALAPIRSTWDEKEQALMAQTNDSVSGNITATRVSDAALSTLSYERQARVAAQLPTGRVYPTSKADDKKAALINVVLTRYIMPNADSQFDMLIKLRLWGVYASVYGSMPMFYDYRADDRYRGPDCWLVNPRCFAPVAGMSNVQEAGCYITTVVHKTFLEEILERKVTSYDKKAIKKLLKLMKENASKPASDGNNQKRNTTVESRYNLANADDRVEWTTKYVHGRWITFAPDFADMESDEDLIVRDMASPHKSGRIPVVMRHCFPVLDSIFGLGDFERGMKVQKAKDSIINLFLEGAKNRVYPPLKMIDNMLTPSTIRYQAGSKWKVKQQNAVEAMQFGDAPLGEFQATYAALQGMLQNMFGTSTTEVSESQGGPSMGKTPEALKMQSARENARDTWDRFMHEKATEELLEGMVNLLHVKMEKPIDLSVFEDDIKALGYAEEVKEIKDPASGNVIQQGQEASKVTGLDVFSGGKAGKLTVNKKDISSDTGYKFYIDANSSMKRDDEESFQALMATWGMMHEDPALVERLAMNNGLEYDEGDHVKNIFIAAGISDWERILKEMSPEKMAELKAKLTAAAQPPAMPGMMPGQMPPQDPMAQMAAQMQQPPMPMGGAPQMQPQMPMQPGQGQMMPQQLPPEMMQQPQPMQQPMMAQAGGQPQFEDPDIAAAAKMMLGAQ